MKTPKSSRTSKTIQQLFDEFLDDQDIRIGPKTFEKYETIIHLYRSYLESYWPGHSGPDYNAVTKAKGTYCGTYGAKDIRSGFYEFLNYFMPYKVIAGNGTMKAAGTVIKKLAKWLVTNGHIQANDVSSDLLGSVARDLPATQSLLD